MNAASSTAICPLCKKPFGTAVEGGAVSRLCDDCRSMVDSLRPARPTNGQAASEPSQPVPQVQAPTQRQQAVPVQTGSAQTSFAQSPTSDFRQIAEAAGGNVPTAPPVFLVPEGGQRASQMPAIGGAQINDNQVWPIVVDTEERKGRSKIWMVIAVMAAIGVGIYLGIRSGLPGSLLGGSKSPSKSQGTANNQAKPSRLGVPVASPQAKTSVGAQPSGSAQPSASRANPVAATTPSPAHQQPQPSPQTQATQAQQSQSTAAPGAKFTAFQMASFPNQAGASEFLQRLVRAGIPGYVVSAQIPRRGTWYRVRAGKFSNEKEQKQASDDWRRRARAAGVDIQLVPCDYEPPLN